MQKLIKKVTKNCNTKQVIFILTLLFIIFTSKAQSQDPCEYKIKGKVLDEETKEALAFVNVVIEGTQYYSVTDDKGEFHIQNLCEEDYTLSISCLGYCDTTCQCSFYAGKDLSIYLKQEAKSLDAITVAAEKKKEEGTESISQQVLSKDILSTDLTQSLASALSEVEGVTFTSVGSNVQLPVIHGLYGNRVLILNNGFKHGFQNWGTDHAPEIDIATANSVTIVKGAAGVRYGPEALGGAIIVEADPLDLNKPFHANIGTGYQTNGQGYFANTEVSHGLKNWSYHVGASYTQIGDREAPDYLLTNSGKIEQSVNAGLRYTVGDWSFKAYYSFVDQNLAILRSSIANSPTSIIRAFNADEPNFIRSFSYDINEPSQRVQHHLGKFEVNWWYAEDAAFTFRYGKQINQREEFDVRRNAEIPIIDLDLTTDDYQLEWKHPSWFDLDGLVGVQLYTQNNDNNPGTNTTPFIPNYNTFRLSGFLIESLESGQNIYEVGIRFDYESNDVRGRETNQDIFRDEYIFTNLTGSLGYVRQISENATFRTNLGMAWRTPNVAELYSFGQHEFRTQFGLLRYYYNAEGELRTDRVITLNESEVSAERGYKWINEWRTQKARNSFTWTAYTHYIENFIYDRPYAVIGTIRGPMPVFIFDQSDALFVGTDFTWQRDWSTSINGTFGFSYLWSRNIEEDEPLINQAPITTSYKLVWEKEKFWKFDFFQISIRPSYTFEQFQAPRTVRPEELINGLEVITPESEIFDFKDAPAGYFLLDMAWRFKIQQFEASLSVQNLLNTRYRNYLNELRYFADEMGRNFLFTINYNLNSN